MYRLVFILLVALPFCQAAAQDSWVLLQEYDSPHYWAQGLYYDGKLLWHVDSDSGTGENTIYTMNPYNLVVYDSIPSPVDQPWGITATDHNFWLTNGHWGDASPELVRIRTDSFAVDTTIEFNGWYFYGMTWDSVGGNLWVSALQYPSWARYILEFDPESCEVVQWHAWPSNWALGIQYWDGRLWTNTQDWAYPDFTMIMDIDTWQMYNSLTAPNQAPEGIATNGVIWWLSYLRNDYHCIQKVIPPGVGVHDIAAYHSPLQDSTELTDLVFAPMAEFINYGSMPESEIPFVLHVKEEPSGIEIYYDSTVYMPQVQPEEIVQIVYFPIWLEPDSEYKFIFYSNLQTDQYRNNDTLKVTVHTAEVTVVHDLSILGVMEPDELEQQANIYPEIRVCNSGTEFEPIAPVHLDIAHPNGSHTSLTASAFNLSPGEVDTIDFAVFWPPDEGAYIFTFDGQLADDMYPANDLWSVTCLVGMVHDVAPTDILGPQVNMPLAPITPRVLVENLGDFSENAFYTDCSISDSSGGIYWQHMICPPLDPGEQQELAFPNFTPPAASYYTFGFETQLGTDNVPENDTIALTSAVGLVWDVAPLEVLAPPSILTPDPFAPKAIISNLGTVPAAAFYAYCLVDTDSVAFYTLQGSIPYLEVGESDTVTFQTITLAQPATYRFRFATAWQLDTHPENDTLVYWAELPVGVGARSAEIVTEFKLEGGFPNPFNAQTAFILHLPAPASVALEIYSLQGQRIRIIDWGQFEAGVHQTVFEAGDLPSGVYVGRVQAGKYHATVKMALLK